MASIVMLVILQVVAVAVPDQPSGAESGNSSRRLSGLTAGTETLTGSLSDTGCYAPKADGGWGFCGPLSCKEMYVTCPDSGGGPPTVDGVTGTYGVDGQTTYSASNCNPFLDLSSTAAKTDWIAKGQCDSTCTQVTTGVCSATFLASVLVGTGVKKAYCNDKWLVISASGVPSVFTPNLNDIPFPPGRAGTNFRTGMLSMTEDKSEALYFPLSITDLSTSAGTNNQDVFDSTSGSGPQSYLIDGSSVYSLPSDAGIAMGVNGQPVFPIYNNNAAYTPQKCEVDSCGNHVGQGGGQPHFHGDPFSDQTTYNCLYGPSNYSNGETGHPPVVAFSYDGHLIYGRYLSSSAPGFASPLLDDCGGHAHSAADVDEHGLSLQTYHYHTQVFDAVCPANGKCTSGETYKASSTGPFKCWKADLKLAEGSSALIAATTSSAYKGKDDMGYRCCGMTDYYALTGIDVSADVAASSTCTVPAAPTNGAYSSGVPCVSGGTLYSGNQCLPTCNSGYTVSGTTRCVKGALTETATCVADTAGGSTPVPTPVPGTGTPVPTPAPGAGTVTPVPTPAPGSGTATPIPTAAPGNGTATTVAPSATTIAPGVASGSVASHLHQLCIVLVLGMICNLCLGF